MDADTNLVCFLLTHDYQDTRRGFVLTLHAAGADGKPVRVVVDNYRPLFFVPRSTPPELTSSAAERKTLEFRAMDGPEVDCLYFATYRACRECAQRIRTAGHRTYESDVQPVERYLMERMVTGGFEVDGEEGMAGGVRVCRNPRLRGCDARPSLSVLSFDIETCVSRGELYSVACSGRRDAVFIIGEPADNGPVRFCGDEREVLVRFAEHVREEDPDVLIGWNVVDFDLDFLGRRYEAHRLPFSIGRGGDVRLFTSGGTGKRVARVPGRVVMDVPLMLRSYYHTFDSYALDFVASRMLGERKTVAATGREKIDEIDRLFAQDKPALAEYNLRDAVLTKRIFAEAGLLPDCVERSKRSGLLLDRVGGSVAAFDYLYLPRLHRHGYVGLDVDDAPGPRAPLPGGYVMDSRPGILQNVLLLDFKSLYPTIIQTFLIDPLGAIAPCSSRVKGPVGPSFAREPTILPGIIEELLAARAEAKRTGNQPLSQAIKILMNSFYGVLGAQGCRFFSEELASTITGTGQYILKTTCKRIEEAFSFPVIYGDTDSLFVLLGSGREAGAAAKAEEIVSDVNAWLHGHLADAFGVESVLELEFESHFRYFLMPTIRGSTQGSKKRYCGAEERDGELVLHFKGMESARSDWTDMAKDFQHELYAKVFRGEPVEEFIVAAVKGVRDGRADDRLVYQKHLRKPLAEYTSNIPPHAQAALLLDKPPRVVRYYITVDGPQPEGKRTAAIDYEHYVECQLKPIADSILEWIGLEFDAVVSGQQDLFGGG